MDKITLKNTLHHTTTILPNEFIDHYMIKADGEYVKIYLLILRLMNQNLPVEIEQLADTLELTQKDILRALKYWEKEGLLAMEDTGKQFRTGHGTDRPDDFHSFGVTRRPATAIPIPRCRRFRKRRAAICLR